MDPQDLLTRAVSELMPKGLAEKKLASGQPMRIYLGIDPTGAKLHLGHAVPLRKLRAFQEAGHQVIFLVGSFTAMVGDPSGRDTMREPLTKEQVQKNFETYKEQASKVLDFSKVEIRYNHEWLEKLGFADILKLAGTFTVQQMIQRDMFQKRIKDGNEISITEFLYPLMVGYDSVMLDVDAELGGSDQLFNMLCGRDLQRAFGKREKFVLTTKLIEGTDGRKMSKTYDNCIWLEDSAEEMYGKILSIKDALIITYFECCTDVPMADVAQIQKSLESSALEEAEGTATAVAANPKDVKMRLAREIVTQFHGADAATKAETAFQKVFGKGETPEDIQNVKVAPGSVLIDILVKEKLVPSKAEARRLVMQKGLHIGEGANASAIETIAFKVGDKFSAEEWGRGVVVKVGKRRFVRISM